MRACQKALTEGLEWAGLPDFASKVARNGDEVSSVFASGRVEVWHVHHCESGKRGFQKVAMGVRRLVAV